MLPSLHLRSKNLEGLGKAVFLEQLCQNEEPIVLHYSPAERAVKTLTPFWFHLK